MRYDVIWYWFGGEVEGAWHSVVPRDDIAEHARLIERSGFVAVLGKRSIGKPEGAPCAKRIREVLALR